MNEIINNWKAGKFNPINWFEGEEPYYLDKIVDFAEANLVPEDQKDFNLTVLYGKDADWVTVVNACKSFPMFGDRRLIIIKEAQQMKDIEKLESYFTNPQPSSLLLIVYKGGKVDKRKSFGKLASKVGNYFESKKVWDSDLPKFGEAIINSKGYKIGQKALMLLVEHIGNDLSRIENEVEKLTVNIKEGRKEITEDDIERYIGISKEYNVFELQSAIANKNFSKAINIVNYFESNPKAAPLQLLLPTIYSFFSKLYQMSGVSFYNENDLIKQVPGLNYFSAKEAVIAYRNYQDVGVEKAILILQNYNMKMLGMDRGDATDGQILKELVYKLIFA